MERLLYLTSRDSKDFHSRKPNSFPRFPFSCGAGTQTPYPTSYSYAITSDCKLPAGFTHALASAFPEKRSTTAGWNLKALPGSCWKFTCAWLMRCLSWTEPSSKKASSIGENTKTRQGNKFLCLHRAQHPVPPASKETVVNLSGELLDNAVYSALRKGLNYAVALAILPRDDILTGVEKGCQVTAC